MTLWNDIRIAARVLLRERGVTLAAVAALALGIAATNTVFTIVNGALLKDMPFDQPDRIVVLGTRAAQGNRGVSYADLRDWRERLRTFDGIAGFAQTTMNVSDEDRGAERLSGALVDASVFRLIGHAPILGRDFVPDDDRPGAQPVVVLGHAAWRNRYGSDPGVLGRTLRINGVPSVIIGVMAEGFMFPFRAEAWQPLGLLARDTRERRDMRTLGVVGRLRGGVTREQARNDLGIVLAGLAREHPATNAGLEPRVEEYRTLGVGEEIRVVFYALLGAVVFVLLIACANVANLLLARAADRAREVSVRMAVGASRWQIVRQLLVESLLLSVIAGVIGFGLSVVSVRLFTRAVTGTGEPYWLDFTMDPGVFAFFAAVCLGTALIFGLAPALHTSGLNVSGTLNESGRSGTGTMRARRWAGALVVGQLALALVLLTGAGLMMRTFLAMFQLDTGIPTAGLVRMRLDLTEQKYPSAPDRVAFYQRLDERLASAPGLRATVASGAPRDGAPAHELSIDGRRNPEGTPRPTVTFMTIGRRYFDTLGARAVRGRDFGVGDGASEPIGIVNERFAELHFPNEDPIGRRIRLTPTGGPPTGPLAADVGEREIRIVGVAPNIRQRDPGGTIDAFDPIVYVPYASNPLPFATILVRSEADGGVVAAQLRQQVAALDPDLPVFDVMTLDEALASDRWPLRVFGGMFGIFALVALVMATVGLYAVTSYSVAQRTREIGVRVALGARAREIWLVITRRAAVQLAIGLLVGMAGAVGMGRLLQGILVRVSATDPVTLTLVPAVLVLVGFVACLIPARRAMRLDPVAALRHE
jgi:predicted permease